MTWLKYILLSIMLVVLSLVAAGFWLLKTESGAAFAWARVTGALDGDLNGNLAGGSLAKGIEIRALQLQSGDIELSVAVSRLAIGVGLLPLDVRLTGVELRDISLTVAASESTAETDIESLLSGLRLPFRLDVADARIDEFEILVAGGEPISIEAIATSLTWQETIDLRRLQVANSGDSLQLSGRIVLAPPQSAELAVDLMYDSIAVRGDVTANTQSLRSENLSITGDEVEARASAILTWAEGLAASGSLDVARYDLGAVLDSWPAAKPVYGGAEFEFSEQRIRLTNARVKVNGAPSVLQFDASFDRHTSQLAADLGWQDVRWPIDARIPDVSSRSANLSLAGDLDDWRVGGEVVVSSRDVPEGQFEIRGGGDRDRLQLTIESGRVFDGTIAGQVGFSWRDNMAWSLVAELDGIRTAGVAPDWPGVLSGKIDAHGAQDPFAVSLNLQDVKGSLAGKALAATGSIRWSGQEATAKDLSITIGSNSVILNGSADSAAGMAFEADIQTGEWSDDIEGRVALDGRLSRYEDKPLLAVNASSPVLTVGNAKLSGFRINDQRAADDVAGFRLEVDAIEAGGRSLTDIEVVAAVRKDEQRLDIHALSGGVAVGLSLAGAFETWSLNELTPWRGEITSLLIGLDDEHSMRLAQAATLEFTPAQSGIRQLCLDDGASSSICIDASRRQDGRIDLNAAFAGLPLAIIEHIVDTEASFDQLISGTVAWRGNPDIAATGKGDLRISSGVVTSRLQPSMSVATGEGILRFEIVDGDVLSGTASLPLPGVGGIDANFEVPDLIDMAASDVSGYIDVDMTDIGFLALFSKWIDTASGSLRANLDLSGKVSNPLLTGSFALQNAAVAYLPVGLEIEDIHLAGELTENRAVELSGSFRAGEGRAQVISSADYRDTEEAGMRFKIRGEDLLLVDVPDVHLSANPDLEIAWRKQNLDINGSLLIPRVRITPSNLIDNSVTESADIVIVAGQMPEDRVQESPESKLTFGGELRIDLGDDVVIDLSVARARLTGGADFEWQGEPMPVVEGRYDLSGEISAFGQRLEIAEGAILYSSVPANEPYLRIRAERDIFGNSQVKRAGVLVDGLASRPSIEAYTSPLTTEERALTLLVTGSDFDYEQGIGAVDFGTYIAPRLFVSYGIGIFDRENIISARYDLTKGFGIKATSGEKQSGVDLNYRFEN